MASKKIPGFPDVSNKLQAPTKKSLFERQKADAEAKRQREAAETAAVYQDFVKSFDDDDGDDDNSASVRRDEGRGGFGGGRHFGRGGIPTGPGAGRGYGGRGGLSSGPGSLGPPPINQGRKRNFEGFSQIGPRRDREERGLLAFGDYESTTPSNVLRISDNEDEKIAKDREEEKAVAKPTLRLASLPPGTSPAVIKALIPANLVVENVKILPPSGPGHVTERKSMSAIVTLAKDTAANDSDTAVSSLQNKYLGYGYYLTLHRHLSSAAISSTTTTSTLSTTTTSHPFGAKAVALPSAGPGMPHPHPRGFAPPTSYGPPIPQSLRSSTPLLHIPVQPPNDIKSLRLIHKTLESLLTHGPEFEALLMSRPSVQREEKWSFLFDARSVGGVYYRYRLWEILTGTHSRRGQGRYLPLFEGGSAWKQPDEPLNFEYVTRLDEFVSDSEYISDSDSDSGADEARNRNMEQGGNAGGDEGKTYLAPLQKAKLIHLLARLPTSTSKLRRGDVARVTAFAISHAGRGSDEVVTALIDNLFHPFCYSSANPSHIPSSRRQRRKSPNAAEDGGGSEPKERKKEEDEEEGEEEGEDISATAIITLHLISSILSTSSTSGVRHAWRYRQLIETALRSRRVFEYLGVCEKKGKWGRLRGEKWKRQVLSVLGLWEGWCACSGEGMEHFKRMFENPPMGEKGEEEEERERRAREEKERERGRSRWKAVELEAATRKVEQQEEEEEEGGEDIDGEPMDEDLDGIPMEDEDEDEDVDGEPMLEDDNNIDGEPLENHDPPAVEMQQGVTVVEKEKGKEEEGGRKEMEKEKEKESMKSKALLGSLAHTPKAEGQPMRRRMRAVDMFADSDDDEA